MKILVIFILMIVSKNTMAASIIIVSTAQR